MAGADATVYCAQCTVCTIICGFCSHMLYEYLAKKPDTEYTDALAPTLKDSVLMRRFRLFFEFYKDVPVDPQH